MCGPTCGLSPVPVAMTIPKSTEAQRLLDFLRKMRGQRVLSGQHNYPSGLTAASDRVAALTGKQPYVWGADLGFIATGNPLAEYRHCGPVNVVGPDSASPQVREVDIEAYREELVRTAIAQHGRGHLVTLMWHCPWPSYGDHGPYEAIWTFEKRPDAATWEQLTTPGTEIHDQWQVQVDRIAKHLAALREARVPVLWRPYHEMNGVWFWWCKQPGPTGFAELWKQMVERFSQVHGLDNLVWVWNSNAPRNIPTDEAYPYADYYPGGEWVDVLAADVYRGDYQQHHYEQLKQLAAGHPIALAEVGELPRAAFLEHQPEWSWFMMWPGFFPSDGPTVFGNSHETFRGLYESSRVCSLAQQ